MIFNHKNINVNDEMTLNTTSPALFLFYFTPDVKDLLSGTKKKKQTMNFCKVQKSTKKNLTAMTH